MKNITKIGILGGLIASTVWSTPVALTSSGNPGSKVTNHPVLFVHGINSSMAGWGAANAYDDYGCLTALEAGDLDFDIINIKAKKIGTKDDSSPYFSVTGDIQVNPNCGSVGAKNIYLKQAFNVAKMGKDCIKNGAEKIELQFSDLIYSKTGTKGIFKGVVDHTCFDSQNNEISIGQTSKRIGVSRGSEAAPRYNVECADDINSGTSKVTISNITSKAFYGRHEYDNTFEVNGDITFEGKCKDGKDVVFKDQPLINLGNECISWGNSSTRVEVDFTNLSLKANSKNVLVGDYSYKCFYGEKPVLHTMVDASVEVSNMKSNFLSKNTELSDNTDLTGTLKDSHTPGKFVKFLDLKNGDEDSYNESPQGGPIDFFKLRKGSNGSGLYLYNSRKVTGFDPNENRKIKSACTPELKQLHTSLNPNQFDAGGSANSSGSINYNNISFKSTLQCGAVLTNKFDRPNFVGNSQNNLNACLSREGCSIKSSTVDSRTWLAEITFDDNSILVADFSALKAPYSNQFNITRLKNLTLVIDSLAPAPWETAGVPGQSQLLLERIYEVLDDYYGQGMWVGNPDARIDIVTHSQGGLITRDMLNHMQNNNSVANPINYINQIVNMDTPHFGAVLPTAPSELKKENPIHNETYPNASDFLSKIYYDDKAFDMSGNSRIVTHFEECDYCVHDGILYWTASGSLKNGLTIDTEADGPYLWNEDPDAESFMDDNQLAGLMQSAQHMSWDANWIREVNSFNYPRKPLSNDLIPMTNLVATSDENIFENMFNSLENFANEACLEQMENMDGVYPGQTCRRFARDVITRQNSKDILALAKKTDTKFGKNSDMVVEAPSQAGANILKGYEPGKGSFNVKSYKRNTKTIAHMDVDNPQHPKTGVTREGCDVFEILTLAKTNYTQNGCGKLGRQLVGIKTAYKVALTTPRPSPQSEEKENVTSIILQPYSEDQALPPVIEYFVKAEPIHKPKVSLVSGSVSNLTLTQVKGSLYKASYQANDLNPVEISFTYEDNTPWDYQNDPSMPLDTTLSIDRNIIFSNADDYQGGVEPDLYKSEWETDLYKVEVSGIERSPYSTVSKPRLKLKNTGSKIINDIVIRYFIRSPDSVELDVWSFAGQDKGEIRLENHDNNLYSVTILYKDLGLLQGQELSWIDFELHHPWSSSKEWDKTDDPTQITSEMQLIKTQVIQPGENTALPSWLK
jgi:hypothetical protein